MSVAAYSAPAKTLHWLSALAIICVVPLGIAMVNATPGPTQNQLYDLHRSFGALVLALSGARLLWRLYVPPPPLIGVMPAWQALAARTTHAALYVLLFLVPLLGWSGTSAFGAKIIVFGLFELPPIVSKDQELAGTLLGMHVYSALALCGILAVHAGAALHHHFVRKDETLRRMLP
jgi:cytochrome b561